MSDTLASATLITFLASLFNTKPFGNSFCFLFSFTVLLYEYISPIKGPYRFLPAQVLFYSDLQIFTSIRPVTAFFLNFVKISVIAEYNAIECCHISAFIEETEKSKNAVYTARGKSNGR